MRLRSEKGQSTTGGQNKAMGLIHHPSPCLATSRRRALSSCSSNARRKGRAEVTEKNPLLLQSCLLKPLGFRPCPGQAADSNHQPCPRQVHLHPALAEAKAGLLADPLRVIDASTPEGMPTSLRVSSVLRVLGWVLGSADHLQPWCCCGATRARWDISSAHSGRRLPTLARVTGKIVGRHGGSGSCFCCKPSASKWLKAEPKGDTKGCGEGK